MLDADRQAQHAFRDARVGQLGRIERAVGGRGRMRRQRLGIADIDQAGEQLQRTRAPAALGSPAEAIFSPKDRRPEALPSLYFCTSAWSGAILHAGVIDPSHVRMPWPFAERRALELSVNLDWVENERWSGKAMIPCAPRILPSYCRWKPTPSYRGLAPRLPYAACCQLGPPLAPRAAG